MVITNEEGQIFELTKWVRQGDPLSSTLFNTALEEIFRKNEWKGKGININGAWLNNLRFADDVVILANNREDLIKMTEELQNVSASAGLEINIGKTNIMTNNNNENNDLKINNNKIKIVDNLIYLGQTTSTKDRLYRKIKRRTKIGWNKCWS